MSAGFVEMCTELAHRRWPASGAAGQVPALPQRTHCLPCCRFENVTCAVPGSRFNDSHWGNTAGLNGQRAGHGRPVGAPGLAAAGAKQADMVRILPVVLLHVLIRTLSGLHVNPETPGLLRLYWAKLLLERHSACLRYAGVQSCAR